MLPRRRLTGAALLAACFVALVLPATLASAATPSAHGYWWRLQSGRGPDLPPPAVVPDGGMWVSADAAGQASVSAMRYRAPSGAEIRTVALTVASSSGQGAAMLACPAKGSWSATQAGAWNKRPGTACDVAFVNGVVSADGSRWTFDVRGLARSGTLDIVILPPPDVPSTFSIAFERPGSSSVVTQRLPGSPSPSSSASAEESPNAGRVVPSPTRVLSEKTQLPASPSMALPYPSPGSPSAVLAAPPEQAAENPARSRSLLMALATVLAVGVLAGWTLWKPDAAA